MREWPADAVCVLDDATFISYRTVMAEAAARQRLPLICRFREMADDAETVVLDFVQPQLAGGRRWGSRRETWGDKAGRKGPHGGAIS
jgi:hypothetical protein